MTDSNTLFDDEPALRLADLAGAFKAVNAITGAQLRDARGAMTLKRASVLTGHSTTTLMWWERVGPASQDEAEAVMGVYRANKRQA